MSGPETDLSIFKDDAGRWRTSTLFEETNKYPERYTALFTLAENDVKLKDGRTLVSMKRIYMEARDPTEYRAAKRIFSTWEIWENLTKAAFFQDTLANWRSELKRQMRSEAIDEINSMAKGKKATGTAFSAAKWIAEATWERSNNNADSDTFDKPVPKNGNGAGRPSKESMRREATAIAKEMTETYGDYEKDWKRIIGEIPARIDS